MADLKTKPTKSSVEAFLGGLVDESRRRDCRTLIRIMKRAAKAPPTMWGPSIVGFGAYHYRYASGREGDWFVTGFSPRKHDLTLYIMAGFEPYEGLMAKLGRCKTGKSCLYVKNLADVDLTVLEELIAASVKHIEKTYP